MMGANSSAYLTGPLLDRLSRVGDYLRGRLIEALRYLCKICIYIQNTGLEISESGRH